MADSHLYANRLRKRYPHDDVEALDRLRADAKEVESTLNSEGWRLICELLDEAYQGGLGTLLNMSLPTSSHEAMARMTGYLAGIREPQIAATAFVALRDEREPK